MPTITQLQYILSVSKYKHFGRASEACHVSQPSLSAQIQKAEDELGLQIFDRNQKPIAVTAKGQKVIGQTQKMLAEYDRLLEVSRFETEEVRGEFKLGVIPTMSSSIIPLFVKSFSANYPMVDLYIEELTTENIVQSLKNSEIDAGILATPLSETNIEKRVLFNEGFAVYCSEDHPLLDKYELTVSDLLEHNDLWILSDGHCFKNQVLNFCGMGDSLEVLSNIHFQSGNLETLKRLVEKAHGYTFLPQLNLDHLSSSEKARVRRFRPPVPSREISIVSRLSHWKRDIIDALEEEIKKNFPTQLNEGNQMSYQIIDID